MEILALLPVEPTRARLFDIKHDLELLTRDSLLLGIQKLKARGYPVVMNSDRTAVCLDRRFFADAQIAAGIYFDTVYG